MADAMPDSDRGVYAISVAADLVGMGVKNLRLYEARGLLEPERTDGGTWQPLPRVGRPAGRWRRRPRRCR